jgi:acyl carrier protein
MSIDDSTLRRQVRELVRDCLQIELGADDDAAELNLDSMAMLELLVGLEKTLGLAVDESELDAPENFRSIDSIVRFVNRQRAMAGHEVREA